MTTAGAADVVVIVFVACGVVVVLGVVAVGTCVVEADMRVAVLVLGRVDVAKRLAVVDVVVAVCPASLVAGRPSTDGADWTSSPRSVERPESGSDAASGARGAEAEFGKLVSHTTAGLDCVGRVGKPGNG